MACGGNESGGAEAQSAQAATPTPAPAGSETGQVHEVRMLLTADGRYAFEPATLAIAPGDRVRWVNVSGGPHNVAFYPDKIPAAAKDLLNAAMADRMGDLVGRLLVQPNEAYEIVFAGAPPGTYDYYCTPHEMLGMKAQLTVQ
jgi:plastocyanin